MKDYIPLNFDLLTSPLSWVVVLLIVLIGGVGLGLVFHPANNLAGE
jgi:hypothetical protein